MAARPAAAWAASSPRNRHFSAFAFRRASSRLREMASLQYLETHAIEHAPRYAAHGLSLCVPIAPPRK